MNNYGGGNPNPWGGQGNSYQGNAGNNMMGGGFNLNNPQAQLAMGLISNLLMQQQQQQQPPMGGMGPTNNQMMGNQGMMGNQPMMGGNMGGGGGGGYYPGPDNFAPRKFSPPRRRFRSPSPRRRGGRAPPPPRRMGGPKSFKNNNQRNEDNKRDKGPKSTQAKSVDKVKSETPEAKVKKPKDEVEEEATTDIPVEEGAEAAAVEEEPKDEAPDGTDKKDEKSAEKRDGKTDKTKANKQQSDGTTYDGLPGAAFRCHLCKKSMWDARSFENHVKGIAHLRMLDETEAIYSKRAKTLRDDSQMEEQKIQRSMEYQAQIGKRPMPNKRDFCKMCDLVIYGSVLEHRRSSSHQALKNHLHPKCSTCQIDLPSRIDLDIHVLTATHLKRLYKDVIGKPESGKKGRQNEKPEKKKTVPIGEYDPEVAVGEDYMMKVTGIFCKLCRKFFLKNDGSLASHCKSKEHYDGLVIAQNEAIKKEKEAEEAEAARQAEEEENEETEAKKAKLEEDSEIYDPYNENAETNGNENAEANENENEEEQQEILEQMKEEDRVQPTEEGGADQELFEGVDEALMEQAAEYGDELNDDGDQYLDGELDKEIDNIEQLGEMEMEEAEQVEKEVFDAVDDIQPAVSSGRGRGRGRRGGRGRGK